MWFLKRKVKINIDFGWEFGILLNMEAIHAFEKSGFIGPFNFVRVISLPSVELGGMNPEAYQLALKEAFSEAKQFGVSLGSCSHCGMGLTHNAIVKGQNGYFVVGLDCAGKIGDPCLADKAKVEQVNIRREQARIKREKKRKLQQEKWLNKICWTGETNRDRLAREATERIAESEALKVKTDKLAVILEPIANVLADNKGGFRDSIAQDMRDGSLPYGNGLYIALEIYGKEFGRKNSKAYKEAFCRAEEIIEKAEKM